MHVDAADAIAVLVTAPECGDDVAVLGELEDRGVRGVIVYTWNETDAVATSAPKDSFERDILIINCTIDGVEDVDATGSGILVPNRHVTSAATDDNV